MKCPKCQSDMTMTAVGWACLNCGNVVAEDAAQSANTALTQGVEPAPPAENSVPPQTSGSVSDAVSQQPGAPAPKPGSVIQPEAPSPAKPQPAVIPIPQPPPLAAGPPPKSFKVPLIVAVIALLLIGGSAAAFYVTSKRNSDHPVKTTAVTTNSKKTQNAAASSTTLAAGVKDCGKAKVTEASKDAFGGCFNQHFASCQPASVTAEAPELNASAQYTIEKKQGSSCLVKWTYVNYPDKPEWANKDMTCPYPIGPDFQTALESQPDYKVCTGELAKLAETEGTPSPSE